MANAHAARASMNAFASALCSAARYWTWEPISEPNAETPTTLVTAQELLAASFARCGRLDPGGG